MKNGYIHKMIYSILYSVQCLVYIACVLHEPITVHRAGRAWKRSTSRKRRLLSEPLVIYCTYKNYLYMEFKNNCFLTVCGPYLWRKVLLSCIARNSFMTRQVAPILSRHLTNTLWHKGSAHYQNCSII